MKKNWWKILGVLLVGYAILGGFLFKVPRLNILNETIRNLNFHVTMWFGMVILLTTSMVYAIKYLKKGDLHYDDKSVEFAKVGILFGVLGILTGAFWANFTWGEPWSGDAKQNAAAICLLIYFAYLVLRNSLQDEQQKGRVSAVYNIFAYSAMIPLLFILPRLSPDSLHPGNGGNPGFNFYDLDSKLRIVFYPAIIGWTLLGAWIATLQIRIKAINRATEDV
jgi:heme exporter protein C